MKTIGILVIALLLSACGKEGTNAQSEPIKCEKPNVVFCSADKSKPCTCDKPWFDWAKHP